MSSPVSEPPPYDTPSAALAATSFPQGYFIIKSRATGRLLDVERAEVLDSTEIILWPEHEHSYVESMRDPLYDNQVFFIDYEGVLCSKHSGHAIDVEDGRLVLRHRKPVSFPFPNSTSHPLPKFAYADGFISVHFPSGSPPPANHSFVLVALPARRPRTILDDAANMLSSAANTVFSGPLAFTGLSSPTTAAHNVDDVHSAGFTLREDELLEEDIIDEEDADDSPDRLRRIRVLAVPNNTNTNVGPEAKARRTWDVTPILKHRVRTGMSQ